MKNTPYYFTLFLLLSLYSCSNGEKEIVLDENGKVVCQSVDECLTGYDFERARMFIGDGFEKDENIKSITIAESKYWADKDQIDKALTVIDETWGIEDYVWPEADWQSWRYNIIDKGVTSCCEKTDFKQAKILALKAADDINVDGQKIGMINESGWRDKKGNVYSFESDCEDKSGKPCIQNTAQGPSMRESLLKKITDYETINK